MVEKRSKNARDKVTDAPGRQNLPELNDEKKILQGALKYLVFKHGHLLVPDAIREEKDGGGLKWIITVHMRYPTGFGGEIGELLYDGHEFTFLTPPEVREKRARKIAEDPEGIRRWHEYRAATLSPGEK